MNTVENIKYRKCEICRGKGTRLILIGKNKLKRVPCTNCCGHGYLVSYGKENAKGETK